MIREIEEKDNKQVEELIRTCLIEFGGSGIANKLLKLALEFAKEHYKECYLETFSNMSAANKFYKKRGFKQLDKPLIETEHYAYDAWYKFTL